MPRQPKVFTFWRVFLVTEEVGSKECSTRRGAGDWAIDNKMLVAGHLYIGHSGLVTKVLGGDFLGFSCSYELASIGF